MLGGNNSDEICLSHMNETGSQLPANQNIFFVYMKSTASLLGKYIVVIVDSGSPSTVLHFPAGRHFNAFVDDLTCKRTSYY